MRRYCLSVVVWLAALGGTAAQERRQAPIIQVSPPAGFEELLAPQTTLVDVYYGGRQLGAFLATFTPDAIRFENPATLVERLPDIRPDQRPMLTDRLGESLPANSDRICWYKGQPNCGVISTDAAALIFDEGLFRADLFVAPGFRSVQGQDGPSYLPPPEARFSGLLGVNLAASAVDADSALNLGLNGIVASESQRLLVVADLDETGRVQVSSLSTQHETRDQLYELGAFSSRGLADSLFIDYDLLGARFERTLATRLDLDRLEATEIELFLLEPSRIEVFKGKRLIGVDSLPAGRHRLDTRNFPYGSYDISLRIVGNSGAVREEQRFFGKTGILPPMGQPLYQLQAGWIQEDHDSGLPRASEVRLVNAGFVTRVSDAFGWQAGLAVSSEQALVEGQAHVFLPDTALNLALALADEQAWGSRLRANYSQRGYGASLSWRKISAAGDPSDPIEFPLLGSPTSDLSLQGFAVVADGTLNLGWRRSSLGNQPAVDEWSLSYRRALRLPGGVPLTWSSSAIWRDDDYLVSTGIEFFFDERPWRVEGGLALSHERTLAESRNFIDKRARLTRFEELGTWRTQHAVEYIGQRDTRSIALTSEAKSAAGEGRIGLFQDNSTEFGRRQGYQINARSSLGFTDSHLAVGDFQRGNAGVVVDLSGFDNRDVRFEVVVDGLNMGLIHGGEARLFSLAPYRSYEVVLQARGDRLVHFNPNPKTVTLYPGSIQRLEWHIESIQVVIAQLVNAAGRALAGMQIEGGNTLGFTDAAGWFQLEVGQQRRFQAKSSKFKCGFVIPRPESSEAVLVLDAITCVEPIR